MGGVCACAPRGKKFHAHKYGLVEMMIFLPCTVTQKPKPMKMVQPIKNIDENDDNENIPIAENDATYHKSG